MIKVSSNNVPAEDSPFAESVNEYPHNILSFLVRNTINSLPDNVVLRRTGHCYDQDYRPLPNSKCLFRRSDTNEPVIGFIIDNNSQPIVFI